MTGFKFVLGEQVQYKGNKCRIISRSLYDTLDGASGIKYCVETLAGYSRDWLDIDEDELIRWSERKILVGETLQEDTTLEQVFQLPIGTVLWAETEQAFFVKCSSYYFVRIYRNSIARASQLLAKDMKVPDREVLEQFIQSEAVTVQFIPEV